MANKALKAARKAYNRSKSTKNRIDIETGKKIKKKKKQETKSHYGQTEQTNKKIGGTNAKKAHEKNKTDKNPVKAHYGQVESKTRSTTGSLGTKISNAYKSNAESAQKNKSKVASSHFGQVTQTKVDVSTANAKKKFGIGTYSTANAKKAKTDSDKTQEKLNKKGEKTVQTLSNADLKAEQDKAEDRAKRETAWYTRQLMARGRMTQDEADEAVKKAGKNARKKTKEDHSLTYSNATMSNEDFLREMNAAPHANVKVKDTKEADKAKREARFYTNREVAAGNMTQEEADKIVKQAGKGHWTTQSANILDKLGGEGTAEESGTRQAGQMNDSKFFSGVLQGMSYGDNTRAIGKYNDKAAELVDTVKNSGAFNAGYMVGQGGQFLLGGTNKMTDALVKGVAKSGALRSALNIGVRKGAADIAFETPLNTLDALKMSRDANGNIDKNAFVKYMALNSGLSGGIGGLIGGAGSKLAKNDAKSFIALSAKANSGASLTEQEVAKLANLQKKFDSIRQGNDVAKTDIVNKADYDAEVGKKVFEKGGTVDDAIKTVNGGSTHTEKIGYANSIKETANAQFEQLRTAREQMLEQAKTASPEEAKVLRQEASKLGSEISRLGEIANTAERQLSIELKRNKKAVTELTQNVKAMSEATGINYRVVNDKDMKKLISEAGGDVSDDYFYKGFYYKNKNGETEILINADSPQAHQTVIGHETGHLIKSANEKEFDDLGNMLEEYAKKNDDFDAVYNQLKRSYPEATEAELREEVTCELLGRYVYGADDKFIKQLAGEKPSVVQRIVDYLKKLVNGTSDKEMAKELQAIIDKTSALVKNIDKNADARFGKSVDDSKFSREIVSKSDEKKYPIAKRQEMVDRAEEMESEYYSPERIHEETDLFRDSEGRWREKPYNPRDDFDVLSDEEYVTIRKEIFKKNSEIGNHDSFMNGTCYSGNHFVKYKTYGDDEFDIEAMFPLDGKHRKEIDDAIREVRGDADSVDSRIEKIRRRTRNDDRDSSPNQYRGESGQDDRLVGGEPRSDGHGNPRPSDGVQSRDDTTLLSKFSKEQKPPQGGSFDAEVEKAFEESAVEEVGKEIKSINDKKALIREITDSDGNITRDADYAYGQAVKTGDMETAQKMVDAALESKGYKYDMYHGSDDFGFTEFKLDEMRVRDKQNKDLAVYLSSKHDVAASYTRNQHIRNLVDKQLDEDSFAELAKIADPEFDVDKLDEMFALKPVRDALEDWRKDFVEYKGDVSSLRGYIEDMIDDARGYNNDLGVHEIPKETLDEIYRLANKIDEGVVQGGVYRGKGKIDKPLVIKAYGGNWANISIEDAAMRKKLAEKFGDDRYGFSTRQIVEYALEDGQYDGVIFKDLYDTGTWGDVHTNLNTYGKSDVYVIFNSNQFKVSDPVVRDNSGNIIPLSERGSDKPDFRFSKESKPKTPTETPTNTPTETKPKETETQKLSDNKYASDELKASVKEIEAAGIYKEEVEKSAKKYNDLDKKIAGLQNRINNAKKKEYPTEAEKTAHIAELEDELRTLRNRQNNVAGEIEQMGKMKAVDNSKTAKEQIRELHGDRSVNEELKNADNLKNEDSWIKDKWNSVRRLWEDSLIDVENVAKKTGGELREQMLTAANRVRNSMNVANNWITHTRKSFDNKVGGKALDDIFTKELIQNEAKYNDFQEYLIMKHVPARHAKGTDIYADISPELAAKRVKELEQEYGDIVEVNGKKMTEIEAWANDVYDYLKDLQQYRVDSGLLSKEAADEFAKDYPFYVPTNRVNDETVDFFTGGTSNGIRTAKGGESEVLDMYSQIYTATNKTIHAAEENQMLNLYFKAKGVTDEQIKQYSLKDLEHATINATVNKKTGAAKVSFFIDGKPVEFPCSHQLALGLRELDGLEFERLMKAAKVATLYGKPFKALITDWNLVFGVRNGMRDLQQAVVNSKDTKYFGSSMGAAAHAIADNNSPYRKAYASMGGEQAQLVSYDAVAERMGLEKGRVDKIHEKVDEWVDASVNVKGKDVNTNPIHYIEGINGAIEMMPRMCEFIGTLRKNADAVLKKQGSSVKKLRKEIVAEVEALEKSGKVGASEVGAEVENRLAERILEIAGKDGLDSAMRNANDITLNFGRSGVIGKALNMGFVPYLNPSIQGLSKLARLFTEAGGEGGWKALASIGMKLGTFTIAPAVWNELALRNNEDFQNINTRDKDNNFFIALGDGKFLKIPKPRENAVLAEPVEYGLRYFLDKTEYDYFDMGKLKNGGSLWEKIPLTDEGKQSFRTALDNIGVINPATSNMFSPLWQTFHNKTWYGGSIESAYEVANKKSQDRYDTGTSGVAIWLGDTAGAKFLNLSPKKIDNIMDSYLGMIYDLGISQTTEEAKTRGNYVVRTMASQFIKDSVFSNKLSTKAWDKIDGMSEEKAQSYKSKYMYDTYKYDDAMDMITADKNMTVQEKMAAKRELQKQKNKINRAAIDGAENESNPLVDIAKHLGAHKTLNNFLPKSGDDKYDTWTDYYKNFKKTKGFKGMNPKQKEKEAQKFLDVYTLGVKGQSKVGGDFHDSPSWGMTGVAAAQRYKQGKLSEKDAKTIMESCGVYESQTESYFKYADHGGNVSRYAVTKKNNNKAEALAEELGVPTSGEGTIWKNKYSKEKGIKGGVLSMSLATGKADFKDRAYYISNSGDANMLIKMNAARGYSEKYGHTTKQLIKLGKKADADGNTYLSNEEIESACMTIKKGKATSEERAMAWVLLGGNPNKNPFGAIGNYAHDGDTGITADDDGKSGGGRRRRGRRGRGGGGGGSSKGTMPSTDTGAIKGKVTDVFSTSNGSKDSNLNDAYRKRARKLRESTNK